MPIRTVGLTPGHRWCGGLRSVKPAVNNGKGARGLVQGPNSLNASYTHPGRISGRPRKLARDLRNRHLRASPPQVARPIPHGCPVEGHAPSPHGFPVLRSISVYRHAVVNTPVARWVLIARGTAYSNRFPVPSGGGLPHIPARSATTLDVSRPAQRSLAITACRLAESPKRPVCLEGSDGFVTSP